MPSTTRVQMKRRPDGFARPDDFEVVTLPRPEPREGEVLVQNIWMSVDPYMRRSMDEDGKDLAPWPIGGAWAQAAAEVAQAVVARLPALEAAPVAQLLLEAELGLALLETLARAADTDRSMEPP